MVQRLTAWGRRHPRAADAIVVLFLFQLAIVIGLSAEGTAEEVQGLWEWALLVVPSISVFWRRTQPVLALIVGTAVTMVAWGLNLPNFALDVAVLTYSAIVYGPRPLAQRTGVACAIVLTLFTILGAYVGDAPVYVVPVVGATLAVSMFFGLSVVNDRAEIERAAQRAAALENIQQHEARHAISEERARIARELHDVVAHGLSVIVVQAGAAQRIIDSDTEGTRNALGQIEMAARDSLNEMRQVLGLLRTDEAEERRPMVGVDALTDLISSCQERGLDVELWMSGDKRPLAATVDAGIYRIVQEALTNVLKHGGAKVKATVNLHFGDEFVHLTVVDDGRGASSFANNNESGHGLLGIRERVEVLDGTVHHGPVIGGGFEVDVTVPIAPLTAKAGER